MKVKFLGTVAAEGGPALFCNCAYCKEAARRGGKDIRSRSQILVNDDLLVDFPADTYMHKIRYNLDFFKIRYLLVTHSHSDHFYPNDLWLHASPSAHDLQEPLMDIYCNQAVKDRFDYVSKDKLADYIAETMRWNVVSEFDKIQNERYEIFALKARHMKEENALFYLIKQGDKAFLQCNDTGTLFEENYEFLSSLGVKIDAIALDSTMGANEQSYFGHMNVRECLQTVERMRKSDFAKPTTRFVLTHFCHNGKLFHDDYEKICSPLGIEVAYDGMEMEL